MGAAGLKEFFKCFLVGILAIINAALYIASLIGFLCFFADIAYAASITQIFSSFMTGFGGLLLGTVLYDCIILLWERMFE